MNTDAKTRVVSVFIRVDLWLFLSCDCQGNCARESCPDSRSRKSSGRPVGRIIEPQRHREPVSSRAAKKLRIWFRAFSCLSWTFSFAISRIEKRQTEKGCPRKTRKDTKV